MTWLYIVGINPRSQWYDTFAITTDFEEAEWYAELANRDGWLRVDIIADEGPEPAEGRTAA